MQEQISLEQMIPIGQICPHPKNPNTHSDLQVDELAKSMTFDGVTMPVLIAPIADGWKAEYGDQPVGAMYVIIAGHGRTLGHEKAGHAEVNCKIMTGYTADRLVAIMLKDNRIAELSNIDSDLLTESLRDLSKTSQDLGLFDDIKLDLPAEEPASVAGLVDDNKPPVKRKFTLSASQDESVAIVLQLVKREQGFDGDSADADALAFLCGAYVG